MQILQTAALLLLQRCAPSVATATMASVVAQESSWHPYAIADASARRRYYPETFASAVAISNELLSLHHKIAVGYAGVFSENFASYNLTPSTALDPCVNLAVGADILNNFYFGRLRAYTPTYATSEACRDTLQRKSDGSLACRSGGALDRYGQKFALSAALQAYNTGSFVGAPDYASDVISRAQRIVVQLPPPPDLSLQQSAAPPQASVNVSTPVATDTPQPRRTPEPRPRLNLKTIFHGSTPPPRRVRP